jgi:hypothetical protein
MLASDWTRTPRRILGAMAIVLTLTGTAMAEPTAAEKETARTLLLSGREKRKAGHDKEALADFEKAHAIMHVPTTGLDLGKTQEALGLLVEARKTYLEASRVPKQPNESAAFENARREAKKLADGITPRLATLTVSVPKDAKVKIDDGEISGSSIGVPLKVNPGKHQIIGTLGSDEKRTTVDLAEGESKSIELELAGAPATTPTPTGDKDKDKDKKGETKLNTLVWVGGGIAAAGVAVGAITGIMAFSIKSDVDSQCDAQHRCKQEVNGLWDEIDRGVLMGNISTGGFVVAAVGGAILVYGLLNPQRAEPSGSTAKIRILPSPFGLAGTF